MPIHIQPDTTAGCPAKARPSATARRRALGLCAACGLLAVLYLALPVLWLGLPAVWTLARPTRVQVFQINPRGAPTGADPAALVDRHAVLAAGRDLDAAGRARLTRVLLDPARYLFGPVNQTACVIAPGVAFRAWRGASSVDVLVCYLCAHLVVATRDPQGRVVREYVTAFPVGRLSPLVRAAFPDDPRLRGALAAFELQQARQAPRPAREAPRCRTTTPLPRLNRP